jgi:hypothetical protein
VTLETLIPLKLKLEGRNRDLPPGAIFTLIDHHGWKLLAKLPYAVRRVDGGPCFACHSTRRWLSVYGAVICGECHPPASLELVERWIETEKESYR